MSGKYYLAALLACLLAGPAVAETQAERDAIRESYFAGFTCHVISQGQPMKLEYLANGQGVQSYQEDDLLFKWWVKNDQFCRKFGTQETSCSPLSDKIVPNERQLYADALKRSCL